MIRKRIFFNSRVLLFSSAEIAHSSFLCIDPSPLRPYNGITGTADAAAEYKKETIMKKESIKASIRKKVANMGVFQQRMIYGYAVLLLKRSRGAEIADEIPQERPAPGQTGKAILSLLEIANKRELYCIRKCVYYVEKHKVVSDLLADGCDIPWIVKMYEDAEKSTRWKEGSYAPLYRRHRLHDKR